MRISTVFKMALVSALLSVPAALPAFSTDPTDLDRVLDRIVERERNLSVTLPQYSPLVETYLQSVKLDPKLGNVPVKDRYFLGRLALSDGTPDTRRSRRAKQAKDRLEDLADDFYSSTLKANGFAQVMLLDRDHFDRQHYDFSFLRREFLGEIRTLVFEVVPKKVKSATFSRFTGRIWVDDQDYNIVRYNGIYGALLGSEVHFDSWRLNLAPGVWFPAYVYTEQSDRVSKKVSIKHRGQTRIWGYDVKEGQDSDEFTKVLVDAPLTNDQADGPGEISPVENLRTWEREAEDNVVRRLQSAGLLSPPGEVSQVLETVIANIELTNGLQIDPPIRARVLMTTPLESFTIGHTIIVSRGLIDVLPDEGSLAMVLAQEMGHVILGHRLDTRYAFSDQVLIGDREAMKTFLFQRQPEEELAANLRAVELLQNSPYKDKLGSAGLFLKTLAAKSRTVPALIRPHFGNPMVSREQISGMMAIVESSPPLDPEDLTQVAALPLGGRVKVDPWNARTELMKNNRVALLSAREKMPLQVTPLMPYLARYGSSANPVADQSRQKLMEQVARSASAETRAQEDSEEATDETVAQDRRN